MNPHFHVLIKMLAKRHTCAADARKSKGEQRATSRRAALALLGVSALASPDRAALAAQAAPLLPERGGIYFCNGCFWGRCAVLPTSVASSSEAHDMLLTTACPRSADRRTLLISS